MLANGPGRAGRPVRGANQGTVPDPQVAAVLVAAGVDPTSATWTKASWTKASWTGGVAAPWAKATWTCGAC